MAKKMRIALQFLVAAVIGVLVGGVCHSLGARYDMPALFFAFLALWMVSAGCLFMAVAYSISALTKRAARRLTDR